MTITLDHVVPWGRLFSEYQAMFALSDSDLQRRILGCGDGPASFNAEATARGLRVISCDPIYAFPAEAIEARVQDTYTYMVDEVRQNLHTFVWDHFESPEHLGAVRMQAMQKFLADFEQGKQQGRYQVASLPSLPYDDHEFDVALCSHFLFLYAEQFSMEFHIESVRELCRVAKDVRIFPLLGMDGEASPHVEPVMAALRKDGFTAERVGVPYEFQVGGHTMLRVTV